MAVDAAALRSSLLYECEAPASEVVADMDGIRAMDQIYEGRKRIGGWCIGLGIVVVILGIVLAAVTENGALAIISGVGAVGVIAGIVIRIINSRGDVEDRRYELIEGLLPMLEADMSPNATVSVRIDLSPPDDKRKFVNKGAIGPWKVKFYEDPWLSLSGRLVDGTRFTISATEFTQRRSRWKTNPRGKKKYKTKKKFRSEFQLDLGYKSKRYGAAEDLANDISGAFQLPDQIQLKRARISDGALQVRTRIKNGWHGKPPTPDAGDVAFRSGPHHLALVFLGAYQALNLARTMTRPGGAQ